MSTEAKLEINVKEIHKIINDKIFFIDKKPMKECVICMEHIKNTDRTILKCGHEFHATCMFSSVVKANSSCPLCRTEVSEKPEERPDLTRSLTRLFIQNELNEQNMSSVLAQMFRNSAYYRDNNNSNKWSDVSPTQRAVMSESLIDFMVDFSSKMGNRIDLWIKQGNDRMVIPEEFETQPLSVPMSAYDDVEQDDDDGYDTYESDTDSDMPELVDETGNIVNHCETEEVLIIPLFADLDHDIDGLFCSEWFMQHYFSNRQRELFADRIRNNAWLNIFDNLLNSDIIRIMTPPESQDVLFDSQQAEEILNCIAFYHFDHC